MYEMITPSFRSHNRRSIYDNRESQSANRNTVPRIPSRWSLRGIYVLDRLASESANPTTPTVTQHGRSAGNLVASREP